MISGLLQGLEATANKASIQEDQAKDAIAAIRNLDKVVKAILAKLSFTVTIEAWPGMYPSTCLDLAERYPGLDFLHNGKTLPEDEPNEQPAPVVARRSVFHTPDYCRNCAYHRDEHLPDAAHEPPHRALAIEAKGLAAGTCRFVPWPEKAEKP